MDDEIELVPLLRGFGENGVDGGEIGHVAMADDAAADLGRQRLDALLELVALVGEGELGALGGAGLGDAPGDRMIIGENRRSGRAYPRAIPRYPPFLGSPDFGGRSIA